MGRGAPETPTSCQSSTVESLPPAASAAADSARSRRRARRRGHFLRTPRGTLRRSPRCLARCASTAASSRRWGGPSQAAGHAAGTPVLRQRRVARQPRRWRGGRCRLAGRYARAEWFETQLALEAMQATQAAAISSLHAGLAVSADDTLDEGLSSMRTDDAVSMSPPPPHRAHLRPRGRDGLLADLLLDLTSATAARCPSRRRAASLMSQAQ